MSVYLVGAGPGDPGLLTVRGWDLLAGADAVLLDALVDRRILEVVSPSAVVLDVGKRGGPEPGGHTAHSTSQQTINDLLVEYGRRYNCVVRLKGGDPFVLGRGGEEALALAAAGVSYEIVPGVSSAIAGPAYAGIPVTQRGIAASVTIVTGHESAGKEPGRGVDWQRLATASDTLVILMGVGHLASIVEQLLASGRAPETPAAIVEQATTARQRVVAGQLRRLPELSAAAAVRSPAVIVVGEVARLHETLAWFGSPPCA